MLLLVSTVERHGFGGIQMVNRLLLEALRRYEKPVSVVSLWDRKNEPWLSSWPGSYGATGSRLRFANAALLRQRWTRNSIILATHVGLAPVGRLVKSISNSQLVVFLHGVESWRPLPKLTTWGLRACDRFVTNSRHTLEEFRRANPAFSGTTADVCYLPARSLRTVPHAEWEGRSQHIPLRVLIVGRLWGRGLRKGQRELIALWPKIVVDFPDAELWVVGGGEGRAELEELARSLGVAAHIHFPGAISDAELDDLYASAAIYAMPSWGEGFGLVFAEAMAHGLPCIASRFDAGKEVVIDGETGYVVDPQAPEEILDRLQRLLADSKLRARMGQAGRDRARECFTIEQFHKNVIRILNV